MFLPEHTWALGVTYARGASSVGLNINGTGWEKNQRDDFYYQRLISTIRLPQNRQRFSTVAGYMSDNDPYALADLVASHRVNGKIEALLQVQNLGDRYFNDFNAESASLGRQVKFGARVRTP
jgi:outer membrane receptor for ferric coprogen and ferric-rhodotorulic acid